MDQQPNANESDAVHNICYSRIHSNVPGVLALVVSEPIYVPASEWKACLEKIEELTSTNWVGLCET